MYKLISCIVKVGLPFLDVRMHLCVDAVLDGGVSFVGHCDLELLPHFYNNRVGGIISLII